MAEYRALDAYGGDAAASYDKYRFRSLRGRFVDALEWRLLRRGLDCISETAGGFGSVLDVPTGTGRMSRRLLDRDYKVTAVDASSDMLCLAEHRCPSANSIHGRIEAIPLPDASIDVAVSLRLFGHLPEVSKENGLAELHRVTRVGAVICFAADSPWLRVRRSIQRRRGRSLDHWHPVTELEAVSLARDAGFKVAKVLSLCGWYSETRGLVLLKQVSDS